MRITFIGHSTCLIEIGGKKILTDPVWANRLSFFIKRLQKPAQKLEEILPVDLVLLSHAHFDHLEIKSLIKINKDTPIVCAKNLRPLLKRRGFSQVFELDWWQTIEIVGLKITSVPAQHFGGRWQIWDRFLEYCGFVISTARESVYFAGDTGYFDAFKNIAEVFKVDTALLPIGAYEAPGKSDFRKIHMDPVQALQAFQELKARFMIPIHFGTYRLSVEPINEPEEWLRELSHTHGLHDKVKILKSGEAFGFSN